MYVYNTRIIDISILVQQTFFFFFADSFSIA